MSSPVSTKIAAGVRFSASGSLEAVTTSLEPGPWSGSSLSAAGAGWVAGRSRPAAAAGDRPYRPMANSVAQQHRFRMVDLCTIDGPGRSTIGEHPLALSTEQLTGLRQQRLRGERFF